ncbi:hypothetical protein ACIBF1_15655 [Spirillospora sp. NPDC050679]
MRIPLRAAAAAAGLTALLTGLLTTGGAAPASAGCAPAWKVVPVPANNVDLVDVDALAPGDVRFTGNVDTGGTALLTWNGKSITPARGRIPQSALHDRFMAGHGSYSSATNAWIKTEPKAGWPNIADTLARWDGAHWTATPGAVSPDPEQAPARANDVVTLSPNTAYAVGGMRGRGGFVQRWDGTEWKAVDHPAAARQGAELFRVAASSADDVWAVGMQRAADGRTRVPLVLHYDGTRWRDVEVPSFATPGMPDALATTVVANGPDDVWLGARRGVYSDPNTNTPLLAHWDGKEWTTVAGTAETGNGQIEALHVAGPRDVWAVVSPNLTHWDGTSWKVVTPQGAQPGDLTYVYRAIDGTAPDDVWAVGVYIYGEESNIPGQPYARVRAVAAHLSCEGR